MRRRIGNNVLFGRKREWKNLNVKDCCDEKDPLKGYNCKTSDGMFVDCIDHTGVVAGKTNDTSFPGFMP